jgi:hypothetical protein
MFKFLLILWNRFKSRSIFGFGGVPFRERTGTPTSKQNHFSSLGGIHKTAYDHFKGRGALTETGSAKMS